MQLSKSIIIPKSLALYNTVVTVVYCVRKKKITEVCGITIHLTNVQKDATPLTYLMN